MRKPLLKTIAVGFKEYQGAINGILSSMERLVAAMLAGAKIFLDAQVSMGGLMMPLPLPNPQTPIVKATNCLLVRQPEPALPAQACIRCGRCSEVCLSSLLPQQLYWFAKR